MVAASPVSPPLPPGRRMLLGSWSAAVRVKLLADGTREAGSPFQQASGNHASAGLLAAKPAPTHWLPCVALSAPWKWWQQVQMPCVVGPLKQWQQRLHPLKCLVLLALLKWWQQSLHPLKCLVLLVPFKWWQQSLHPGKCLVLLVFLTCWQQSLHPLKCLVLLTL